MKLFKVSIVFIGIIFLGCSSQSSVRVSPDFNRFDSEIQLNTQTHTYLQGIFPDGILLLNDSSLMIRSIPGRSPYHFQVMNLKEQGIKKMLLPAGRKHGQSMGFLSYGILNGKIWVNDIIKEKVMLFDTIGGQQFQEFPIPVFYYSTVLLNDSVLLGAGNYDGQFKLESFDMKTGMLLKQLIPYSTDLAYFVPREQKMAYESFLFLKPAGDRCVLASRYADQIEIVDLNNNVSKIIRGPEGFGPDMVVANGNDGKKLSTRNSNTRYAFVKGKTNNKFIYLLFSGHQHESEHLHYGNCIFVYDWEGHPVKKLQFKDDILDFDITSDNSILYACHPKGNFISKTKL